MTLSRPNADRDQTEPDTVSSCIDGLRTDPRFVHVHSVPAREAMWGTLDRPLPESVEAHVPDGGLWEHQATALDLVRSGTSTAIATGTASGKSLVYQLAIAEAIAGSSPATALAIYPTKALGHDQLRAFAQLADCGVVADTYDGDSTEEQRRWARRHANVLLTNPEMVHYSILSDHARWQDYLHRLRFVVIDELHLLRGVFGSHVANVLRRLRRLCQKYGSDPTFVFCSATIGEPAKLAAELSGLPVAAVTTDGSPQGTRRVVLWNPAELDPAGELEIRPSMIEEAATVASQLITAGLRCIVFARSRRLTEVIAQRLAERIGDDGADRVRSYRGGYLPAERRAIEDELRSGSIDAVVATSALELGIDLHALDAAVLCGFPGSMASMWQQIGRAGRAAEHSLAVLIAGEDQLDQWVMDHHLDALDRPPERAVVNPWNPSILDAHLACAAHEYPLHRDDELLWGEALDDGIRRGVLADRLRVRGAGDEARVLWNGRGWPGRALGLRAASRGEVKIRTVDRELVGTVDAGRAPALVHPGAVYLHRGVAWRVLDLDLDNLRATVEPDPGETYTQTRSNSSVRILSSDRAAQVGRSPVNIGDVEVTEHIVGFEERSVADRRLVRRESLEVAPSTLTTRGVWYTFDDLLLADAGLDVEQLGGALHAIEHCAIGMLPLFAICDRWDVGGLSTPHHPDTEEATIIIHEAHLGGVGISELALDAAPRHFAATLGTIERCNCSSGCPSCVQSPKCGNFNEPLDKAAAAALLRTILHR